MKNIKLLAGIFLIVTFFSCTNEPIDSAINLDDFGGNNNQPAVFKADFSGTTWTATTYQAVISSNSIQIVGTKPNGDTFAFMIEGNAVGNYAANSNLLAFTPAGSEFGYWSVNNSNPAENTGSISITSIDTVNKKISGTFVYKGYWSDTTTTSILPVQFTNGVFTNIPYTSGTPVSNDNFYAKVNGTEFVDVSILTNSLTFNNSPSIIISAKNAVENSIEITVKKDAIVGVPYFNDTNILNNKFEFRYWEPVPYSLTTLLNGSITITEKTTTRIKGTFYFDAVNSTFAVSNITEGTFDVALP